MAPNRPWAGPSSDPTPLFELFRGNYASELLTAAVAHFHVFDHLAGGPLAADDLRGQTRLAERPFVVLLTALRAMGLVERDGDGKFGLSPHAREHLRRDSPFDVSGYIGLAAESPGVLELVERLTTDLPRGHKPSEGGVGFIYRDDLPSAMEDAAAARRFTLALAGRARNVAPVFAQRAPLADTKKLLDVGGGTGLYSIACLLRHADLRAIIWDRPEVLKVAAEMAAEHGVADRVELIAGDMFVDPVPPGADVILLSNVLHDWHQDDCRPLVARLAEGLASDGRLVIHDVFLNDALDGPLAVALYSAALFTVTQGRAYSGAEYRAWLTEAGLVPTAIVPTLVHCGILSAGRS